MAKKKSRNKATKVFVEILQNGILVAKTDRDLVKGGRLAVTPRMTGELAVPLYPLPADVEFLEIKSGKVFLDVDHHWEGFATTAGELVTIEKIGRGQRRHQLFKGDYGSISLGDLRILVKVEDAVPAKPDALLPKPEYRGAISRFIASDKREAEMLFVSVAASAIVILVLVFALSSRPFHRPSDFRELSADYTLPFINGDHLRNAPELLQRHLDRRDYITSIVDAIHSFAQVLTGQSVTAPERVYPTTLALYRGLYDDQRQFIEAAKYDQIEADEASAADQTRATIVIPSVAGETYNGGLQRLVDKIEIMHYSARINLEKKKSFVAQFDADVELNMTDYRDGKKVKGADSLKYLAQVKLTQQDPNEIRMYKEADSLGSRADLLRRQIDRHAEADIRLDHLLDQPIGLRKGSKYHSFLANPDYFETDDKLYRLQGSEFGITKHKPKVRAPLTGRIDPDLVRKAIEKRAFELQLCYELALRRNDGAGGTMEWRWRIDERGVISDVELMTSSIEDQRMINCIRQKIATWRFPRPRNGSVEVRYPFEFQPARG